MTTAGGHSVTKNYKANPIDSKDRICYKEVSANQPAVLKYKFLPKPDKHSIKEDLRKDDSLGKKSTDSQLVQESRERSSSKQVSVCSKAAYSPQVMPSLGDQQGLTSRLMRTLSPVQHFNRGESEYQHSQKASLQVRGESSCDLDSPARQELLLFQEYARIPTRKDRESIGHTSNVEESPRCSLEKAWVRNYEIGLWGRDLTSSSIEKRDPCTVEQHKNARKREFALAMNLKPVKDDTIRDEDYRAMSSSFSFSQSSQD